MKKILYIAALMMAAASCIYPFETKIKGIDERLVIEGDILIGSQTKVSVSYMMSISGGETQPGRPDADVYVEDNEGGKYEGKKAGKIYVVDTRSASDELQYRLVVHTKNNSRTYASQWQSVSKAPVIDSLGYMISDDRKTMDITISLTTENEKYYRWTFYEEWEYHSFYDAQCYVIPGRFNTRNPADTVAQMIMYADGEINNYYCWNNAESDGILIGTVDGLTQKKLINHKFFSIGSQETKISDLYRMTVTLQSISQSGYEYWKNLDVISNLSGTLDSPNPNEMRGNIECETDPSEYVIGFINVSSVCTSMRYIDNDKTGFYDITPILKQAESENVQEPMWNTYYNMGWLPYMYDEDPMMGVTCYWTSKYCVDCTTRGGSKAKRPSDWPTDHQ